MTSATTLAGTRPASKLVCQESGSRVSCTAAGTCNAAKTSSHHTCSSLRGMERACQQQARLGLSSRCATQGPMATEGEPHFATLPRTNASLDVMQKREEDTASEG